MIYIQFDISNTPKITVWGARGPENSHSQGPTRLDIDSPRQAYDRWKVRRHTLSRTFENLQAPPSARAVQPDPTQRIPNGSGPWHARLRAALRSQLPSAAHTMTSAHETAKSTGQDKTCCSGARRARSTRPRFVRTARGGSRTARRLDRHQLGTNISVASRTSADCSLWFSASVRRLRVDLERDHVHLGG